MRGNDRQRVFTDDIDRFAYLLILSEVGEQAEWARLAHCLMDNHVHMLLETPQPNLSQGMHRLLTRYTQRFNRRHERCGHLFQGRFGAVRVTSDAQFLSVTSYIEQNPVKAGLCDTPNAWRWTDCAAARDRFREGSRVTHGA